MHDEPSTDAADTNNPIGPSERLSFPAAIAAFFFRPSRFMGAVGLRVSTLTIATIAWITGTASTIDQFSDAEQTQFIPEQWWQIWAISMFVGIISGFFIYLMGIWWFRVRLMFSSCTGEPWSKCARAYMVPGTAKQLAIVIFALAMTARYGTFTEYVTDPALGPILVYAAVYGTLDIWSSFTLAFGVLGHFDVKRVPALIWFLFLPAGLRAIAYTLGFAAILVLQSGALYPSPDTTNFRTASNAYYQFQYPGNWTLDTSENNPTFFSAEPKRGWSSFAIYATPEPSPLAAVRSDLIFLEDIGFSMDEAGVPITDLFGFAGQGTERKAVFDGEACTVRVLSTPAGQGNMTLVRVVFFDDEIKVYEPGFEQILGSLIRAP